MEKDETLIAPSQSCVRAIIIVKQMVATREVLPEVLNGAHDFDGYIKWNGTLEQPIFYLKKSVYF